MDGNELILRLPERAQRTVLSVGLSTGLAWRIPQLSCLKRWFRLSGADEGALETIARKAHTWHEWIDRWHDEGDAGRERADRALAEGHQATARLLYHQAAIAYALALWRETDLERRRTLYPPLTRTYAAYGRLAAAPAHPLDIPFDPAPLPGYLRLPADASPERPAPVAVLVQGLDTVKEMNAWAEDALLERGIATLDVDEPGIGEARLRGVTLGVDPLRAAATAIADAISTDPRLDPDRIAVCGWSFGAFVAPFFAAVEPRYRACATLGVMWEFPAPEGMASNPFYGPVLGLYTGYPGAAQRRQLVDTLRELTLAPVAHAIRAPVVSVQGGRDALLAKDAHRLRAATGSTSVLRVVPDDDHGLTWHRDRETPLLWDAVADHLR